MSEQEQFRLIDSSQTPYDIESGVGRFIKEDEIQIFCSGCDFLKTDGVCRLGANDQARYAFRRSM